jgi:RHS repeat-associated protein
VTAVVVLLSTVGQASPAAARSARPTPPAKLSSVAGGIATAPALPVDKVPALKQAPAVAWPAAATVEVSPGAKGRPAFAAGQPFGAAAPAAAPAASTAAGAANARTVTRVRMQLLDRAQAQRSGRDLVLRVGRADQVAAAGRVGVSLRYTPFREAFGGDWARRLRLVSLPECALSTPERDDCQATLLATTNDHAAGTVSADVSLAAAGTALVALAAGPSSDGGDYKATDLKPASSWTAGGNSGGFQWSLPVRTPPSTGPAPGIDLSYASQSVDGFTAAENSQPSMVGEGFTYQPGFIERSYRTCKDDGVADKFDSCWAGHNATMSLGGTSTELVSANAQATLWRPKEEDGSVVERLTDTALANGDADGEYWKVTTIDGTQYFFGKHRLPGYRDGVDPTTNSVFYQPVFGNNAGEPCNSSGGFAVSHCAQAYRWNLDYVIDPNGNSMSLFYDRETNKYARNGVATDATTYVTGGWVREINYGTRQNAGADTVFAGTAPAKVLFTPSERCVTPGATCTLTTANATNWPDVPVDMICTGTSCAGKVAPTFFVTRKLTRITTQVASGVKTWRRVEQWRLTHEFKDPGDGNQKILWLQRVDHCGLDDNTCVPPITLMATQLSNRVDRAGATSSIIRYRMLSITNESGGLITVTYSAPECVAGSVMPASPDTNTKRCFPAWWTPPGLTTPKMEYFHKYVVTAVSEADRTGAGADRQTQYLYLDSPAWHYDADPMALVARRTWGDWRGYSQVRVVTGAAGQTQSRVDYTYFRGMHGDRTGSGGTRTVSIADSDGGTWPDSNWFAGALREEITYLGPTGGVVGKSKRDPYAFGPTATQTINEVTLESRLTSTAVETDTTILDHSPGQRTTRTTNTFVADRTGRLAMTHDEGDVATTADDRCSRMTYASNTAGTMLSYVVRTETVSVPCSATPNRATDVVSDQRTWYDGATSFGTTVSRGNVSRVEDLADHNGGNPIYKPIERNTHDEYGRVRETLDVLGRLASVEYLTGPGGNTTGRREVNPKGWAATADVDPGWGTATRAVDVNGSVTIADYDGLGRLVGVWLPGRVKGTDQADMTFAYDVRTDGPTVVRASKLNPAGTGYITTYSLYDGFLRLRQTQGAAVGGGRMIAETLYDSRGLANKSRPPYFNAGSPEPRLFVPTGDTAVPAQTVTNFDGAERAVRDSYQLQSVEKWNVTVTYGGDRVDASAPPGGTATTLWTDARGGTTALWQYRGNAVTGAHDDTTYAYTKNGDLASVTDAAGNTWRYEYDQRGRMVEATDPDLGESIYTYDDAGQKLTESDPRGQTLAHLYDELGRRTATHVGSTAGRRIAAWTYDSLSKGQLTSATRYDENNNAFVKAITGYTARNQATGARVTIPSAAAGAALSGDYTTAYTYNADGSPRTTQMFRKEGATNFAGLTDETVTAGYDGLGMPRTLSGLTSYATTTDYLQSGQLFSLNLTDGGGKNVLQYWGYQPGTERLAEHQVLADTAPEVARDAFYTQDSAGNITAIADRTAQYNAGPDDVQCFRHDTKRRLAAAWTPATQPCATDPTQAGLGGPAPYWNSYTYDAAGNRTQEVRRTATTTSTRAYAHPGSGTGAVRPHAVQSVTTTGTGAGVSSFAYDAAGNTTTRNIAGKPGQTLAWDVENNLSTVTDSAGTTRYVYDVEGQRLLTRDAGGTTLYLGDTEYRATSTGAVSGTRYYSHGRAGLIAARTSAGLFWQVSDHQGTPQLSYRSGDLALTRRRTEPYGDVRGSSGTWQHSRGFVGGTADATGLVRMGARDYDPASGRFVTLDPIFDLQTPETYNPYGYAGESPVTFSDPDGLWRFRWDRLKKMANGATLAGIGLMVLGVMVGAAGGGLAATGFGAAALPLTSALAAKLVVAGAVTAAAGLAAGAAANVMENRASGGGGGGGGGAKGNKKWENTKEELDDMTKKLMEEHKGTKQGGKPLSEANARASLEGPKGTKAELVPKKPGARTPDVQFVDEYGAVKLRREVKSADKGTFTNQVAEGSEQVAYQGEVFVQVPNSVTAAEARSWVANFRNSQVKSGLGKYKGVNVRIVKQNGEQIGHYNAGTGQPVNPPPAKTPPRKGPKFE